MKIKISALNKLLSGPFNAEPSQGEIDFTKYAKNLIKEVLKQAEIGIAQRGDLIIGGNTKDKHGREWVLKMSLGDESYEVGSLAHLFSEEMEMIEYGTDEGLTALREVLLEAARLIDQKVKP